MISLNLISNKIGLLIAAPAKLLRVDGRTDRKKDTQTHKDRLRYNLLVLPKTLPLSKWQKMVLTSKIRFFGTNILIFEPVLIIISENYLSQMCFQGQKRASCKLGYSFQNSNNADVQIKTEFSLQNSEIREFVFWFVVSRRKKKKTAQNHLQFA